MHVVIVAWEHLHHTGRPAEPGVRPDEDPHGSGTDEPIDEVLRERPRDLHRRVGRPLASVSAWVVDVDVEPVLVRDVARPAIPDAEITTVRATEVADADARRCRVRGRVGVDETQHQPDKPVGAVAAPAAVR